jgi:signal transduction histidine kinase
LPENPASMENDRSAFLSTLPARRADRRLALAVAVASAAIFLAAAPFARQPLAQIQAFLPAYQSALVVNDLITAVLLYGQFRIMRSRALLALASGYLFCALMAVFHLLSFPGLFAPGGLMGAGPQTTAWLYFSWHAGFPFFVIAYALLKDRPPPEGDTRPIGAPILLGVAAALAAAFLLMLMTTAGHDALPEIMRGDADASTKVFIASGTWLLILVALVALWRRRPHSVLDIWVMVVMLVWIFDVALASVLNHGRYDLGWYAGRVYGLLAASFVLIVLLLENGLLYARLAAAHEGERRERRLVQEKSIELAALNKELEAFSYSVSHDLRAPLRAVDGYANMIEEDHGGQLDANARRLLNVLRTSARQMGRMIEDLLEFSRLGRQRPATQQVPLDDLVNGVIAEQRMTHADRAVEFTVGELGVVQADPALLKHVLANLISNAVKYTRGRYPARVEIGSLPRGSPGGAAVYYVKDNGTGFDMRQSHRLFGVFQRFHSAQEFEGTGVGLAIVERIILRHGGRIWAESRPDEGAVFYFTLQPDGADEAKPQSATA